MDPWIAEIVSRFLRHPRYVEHWQPIIEMHHWRDEIAALHARCSPPHQHAAAELEELDRWFCFARNSATVEAMRWFARRIEATLVWARAELDGTPGRCGPHDEPLSLIVCELCRDVSGVGCGYGCGARRACERCWERAPSALRSAQKPGFPNPPDHERRRGHGPICWGCGARGVPLAAPCGYLFEDKEYRCPRAVCAPCHQRRVPCNACAPCEPAAPRPIVTW